MSEKNPENLRLEDSAGYLANHMARLFANALAERLKEIGMAPAQFAVMLALRETGASLQKELVEILDMEQATVANTLSRMERDGLVRREPDPADGRGSLYSLTPLALGRLPAGRDVLARGNEDALAGFSPAERATLVALLQRVLANVEAAEAAAEPPAAEPPAAEPKRPLDNPPPLPSQPTPDPLPPKPQTQPQPPPT